MITQTANHMTKEEFIPFPKMARLSRECFISEKIDGTNAQILITDDGGVFAGSRTRWITPEQDNYGFAQWVKEHQDELRELGPGRHFGEWWGKGIQRNYGLNERRFSLFNVKRWGGLESGRPACCHVVPMLYQGEFETDACYEVLYQLEQLGSAAAPGFMKPEGIIVYHVAAGIAFKKTIEKDQLHKSQQ